MATTRLLAVTLSELVSYRSVRLREDSGDRVDRTKHGDMLEDKGEIEMMMAPLLVYLRL